MKRYDQDFMKKFYVLYIMIYCQYIREREREREIEKKRGAKRIIKREREREREKIGGENKKIISRGKRKNGEKKTNGSK